ncbi:MAG: S1-like domain-containing RNA-binding protein [Gammaproteobacteria bacterium]|nr:S1-like domain-containing RNA-binding protein [Gammaproteobacteria bacterium]
MIELGKLNTLTVLKKLDFGIYLDGGDLDEILLPRRYVPEGCSVGEQLEVFVHLDSEDMLIATTEMPKAMVGECAFLKVVEVNRVGAFLDWGLPKDLLVPFGEQQKPMQVGQSYVVYLYIDPASERIAASTKLDKFLGDTSPYYKEQQAVDLLICGRTDLGYKAVVDGGTIGLLFNSDVFKPISIGQKMKGFIKRIREDKKLDLCLQLVSREALDDLSEKILAFIKAEGGKTTMTEKSPPDVIAKQFGVSKSSYKKALGKLYKKRLILIEKTHIELVK